MYGGTRVCSESLKDIRYTIGNQKKYDTLSEIKRNTIHYRKSNDIRYIFVSLPCVS